MSLFDEYPSYEMEEMVEACHELRHGVYKLNAALEINNILAMESANYTIIMEGKVGDFLRGIKDRLKSFLEKVKSFFASIFKKIDLFMSQSKAFIDKYGNSIEKAMRSGKCEWITYNEKYILDNEQIKMLAEVDKFVVGIKEYIVAIENGAQKILNQQNENRPAGQAQSSQISSGSESEQKFVNEIQKANNSSVNTAKDVQSNNYSDFEKNAVNRINSKYNTFDELLDNFKKVVKVEKKDTESMLNERSGIDILNYVRDHIKEDITSFKNNQTATENNIKQALASLNRIENMTRNLENVNKSLTEWTSNVTKALTICQTINSDRITARTRTFNYYVNILRSFAKKNAKLITKGESIEDETQTDNQNEKQDNKNTEEIKKDTKTLNKQTKAINKNAKAKAKYDKALRKNNASK